MNHPISFKIQTLPQRSSLRRFLPLALLPLAVLAACSSAPTTNARVEEARNSLRIAQADPRTQGLAGAELRQATEALAAADAAVAQRADSAAVDHLAYVAQQRVALLQEAGGRRAAEAAVASANGERDQLRLAARTREVTAAQNTAAASQLDALTAQRQAESAQRQAESAQRDARTSQRSAEGALRDTMAAQREAAVSQQQAGDAERRAAALQAQLADLNAKKTDRGMVVTIGDVLFDTNQSQIKNGGLRSMDKLVAFLKTHPQRRAAIEGFTDSVGSDDLNQALSARRADAVRSALVGLGVGSERLTATGYGEAFPVAGNDSAGGRQMNRRVEIVLSDDGGVVSPR